LPLPPMLHHRSPVLDGSLDFGLTASTSAWLSPAALRDGC